MRLPILLMLLLSGNLFAQTAVFTGTSPSTAVLPAGAEIRIGMSNALSGPTAALGTELRSGATAWFTAVNARGGIHGRKIRLISEDDGYEPAHTITTTRKLLQTDSAFALFGYVGTPTSLVATAIAARAGVPYVAPFTGAAFLRKPVMPTVYNVRAGYDDETEAMVSYLVDKRGFTRIALLVQNDAYGSAGRTCAQDALTRRNLDPVAVAKYHRNTSDVARAVGQLKLAKPQAVIIIGAYAPCAAFIKQSRPAGFNPVFMNISFVGTSGLIKALGAEGEGVFITQVVPSPEDTSIPLVQAYHEDLTAADPSATASYGGLEGYLNARVFTHMLEAAGPSLSRATFISASDALGSFDILGTPLTFNATNHQGSSRVYLTQIRSGKAVPVPLP